MKGLVQQIKEHYEASKNIPPLTDKQLMKLIDEAAKRDRQRFLENEKSRKDNMKHLQKRSKELGKPIPPELLIRFSFEAVPLVGSDFLERYKEWL